MWDSHLHESRYVVWTERGADVWSGVSPGDYSRTLELRVERRADGNVFVLAGQRGALRPLTTAARERAEKRLAQLPTIEEVCEPAHRCLRAADAARERAAGPPPASPLVFGKSVVECRVQTVLALRMIPDGVDVPPECRFALP
jgi:hypothetical protein